MASAAHSILEKTAFWCVDFVVVSQSFYFHEFFFLFSFFLLVRIAILWEIYSQIIGRSLYIILECKYKLFLFSEPSFKAQVTFLYDNRDNSQRKHFILFHT